MSSLPLERAGNHSSFLHFFQMMSPEHLTCGWLLHLLLVFLKPCGAPAGPARPLNGSDCTARGPASYLLVFTGQWSPQAFPKQYPLFRPPAQWSKLMGKSHGCEVITGNPSADGEHRPFFCSFVRGLNYQTHTFTLQTETLGWVLLCFLFCFLNFLISIFFHLPIAGEVVRLIKTYNDMTIATM